MMVFKFQQEFRISELLGGRACQDPGPRPGPQLPLPYLDQMGGGRGVKFSHLEYLPELWISQPLGGRACPGAQPPGLGWAPPRLPYLDRGGGNFPV